MSTPTIAERLTLRPGALVEVAITTDDGDETIWVTITERVEHLGNIGCCLTTTRPTIHHGTEVSSKAMNVLHVTCGPDELPPQVNIKQPSPTGETA
jgi:hypothetical protein